MKRATKKLLCGTCGYEWLQPVWQPVVCPTCASQPHSTFHRHITGAGLIGFGLMLMVPAVLMDVFLLTLPLPPNDKLEQVLVTLLFHLIFLMGAVVFLTGLRLLIQPSQRPGSATRHAIHSLGVCLLAFILLCLATIGYYLWLAFT